MDYRISKVISVEELTKYLKIIYSIDNFDIKAASFFSNHLYKTELKDDIQILLLLLMSTIKKGLSKAFKEDLIATLNTTLDDNELSTLLLHEGIKRDNIEKFLSSGISNIKESINRWIDYLFEKRAFSSFLPIVGDSIKSDSFSQPLVICDPEKKVFWFQAYYIAEKFLKEEGNVLFVTESSSLDIKKVAIILEEIINKEFQGKIPHLRQLIAVILSLLKRVVVISGGPGTGKTTVVSLILKVLIRYYNIPLQKIAICAPTGRAKSRLLEALNTSDRNSFSNLFAYTIHSLLGITSDSSFFALFSSKEKLPYKLIVVDEVSMIDLRLFYSLIARLPSDCRLILIGDTEQLPPVDAGAVLGNLNFLKGSNFSSLSIETIDLIKNIFTLCNFYVNIEELSLLKTDIKSKLVDHIIFLTKNYRSDTQIIEWWNNFVSSGRPPEVNNSYVTYISKKRIEGNSRVHLESILKKWVNRWYENYSEWKNIYGEKLLQHKEIETENDVLKEFSLLISKMRILCCRNEGMQGRIFVNEVCKNIFWSLRGRKGTAPSFYDGIPIIVTRNQYKIELYNGDIGIILESKGKMYACFLSGHKIIYVPLYNISNIDPAFAITVHKSQGSEFDEILFIIPEKVVTPLSKELVYTAITRARKKVTIVDYGDILSNIQNLRTEERYSVLGELWG